MVRHSVLEAGLIGRVFARAPWGLRGGLLLCWLAMATGTEARAEVDPHLLSAQRHARASALLQQTLQKWCHGKPSPTGQATADLDSLTRVEKQFRLERESGQPQQVQRLIERECLAYRLALQEPTFKAPVWYLSRLKILKIRTVADDGLDMTAQADSLAGPIVNSRITFSMGLHQSCFGNTDAKGQVRCRLVDTHPHGGESETVHETTDGELVVSLQGKVSPDLIAWPTASTWSLAGFRHAPKKRVGRVARASIQLDGTGRDQCLPALLILRDHFAQGRSVLVTQIDFHASGRLHHAGALDGVADVQAQ